MTKSKTQNKFKIKMTSSKRKILSFVICNLCLFWILNFGIWISPLFAEGKEEEPVVVNGDKVEYLEDLHQAIGLGHVIITYQNTKLTCDKIIVFVDTKDVYAEGKVTLIQEGDTFSGERMHYNFDSKRGTVIDSRMAIEPWYGGGEQIDKNSDRKFVMFKDYITSCDLPQPHYRIKSQKALIYLKDRIVLYNAVMIVHKFPIFYFPYYSYSLKDNRPNVTVVPGNKKEWGWYVLSAWRIFRNEQSRAYIHLDQREKRGLAAGFDYFYDTTYFGQGKLRTYFMHDQDEQKSVASERDPRPRNRVQLKHQWQVDPNTEAILEYHKYSDPDFIKDFLYREEYEIDNQPPSYLSVIRTKPNYTLSFYARQQANHFETVVEKLPEVSLDIKNTQLKDSNFYYKSQVILSHLNREYGEQDTDDDTDRFDVYNQISYVKKILGWLNMGPYLGIRDTYYSKDINGNDHLIRTIAYSGVDLSTKFYRVFDLETNIWDLDVHKLRHIITPTINYSYINDPSTHSYSLPQFDTIDSISRANTATFSLENKLQTKRPSGKNKKLESVDLLTFILSTDYDFTARENSNFTTVKGDLEIKPYPWLLLESDAAYNARTGGFDTVNEDLVINKGEKWQLGLGNRYQHNVSDELTASLTYKLNQKWTISAYERYYFKKIENGVKSVRELKEQEYTLTRDLHCWWLDLTYNLTGGEGSTFWIIFRMKAFPDMPVALKAHYRPPKKSPEETSTAID